MALFGKPLVTPPVVWKTTEEDGNPSVVVLAVALFVGFFGSLLNRIQ
jgi:hypothetical protein